MPSTVPRGERRIKTPWGKPTSTLRIIPGAPSQIIPDFPVKDPQIWTMGNSEEKFPREISFSPQGALKEVISQTRLLPPHGDFRWNGLLGKIPPFWAQGKIWKSPKKI